MGLAHPDLVFRIQDSIITEPKTLPLKNFKENPKKNAKAKELFGSYRLYIFTCEWSTIHRRTSEVQVILTSVTQAGSA